MNSSVIASVEASGNDLLVTFVGGKSYGYAGAASHAAAIQSAPSAGKYFRANVLGKYAHTAL